MTLLFTQEDLRREITGILQEKVPIDAPHTVIMTIPHLEISIQISRGNMATFQSLLRFWVRAIQEQDWRDRQSFLQPYIESAECRPITEPEFQAQLQQFFDDTRLQIGFEFSGKYLAGMQMFRNWNHQAVLASFEHEVVAISWETTA